MDRRRHHAALVELDAAQKLQMAAARADLADAVGALVEAGEQSRAGRAQLGASETEYDAILAAISFDPDRGRRAGQAILAAEDALAAHRAAEIQAEAREAALRTEWHGHSLRVDAIARRRRQAQRKLVQLAEDKAAIELLALATGREARR